MSVSSFASRVSPAWTPSARTGLTARVRMARVARIRFRRSIVSPRGRTRLHAPCQRGFGVRFALLRDAREAARESLVEDSGARTAGNCDSYAPQTRPQGRAAEL